MAADLSAAQARIAREKAAQNNRKLVNPEEEYDYSERAIAALVYMLPLLDSLKYSKFLFIARPMLSLALLPLAPVISLWGSLGFLQVVVFFATYLGVVQNQNMKRLAHAEASTTTSHSFGYFVDRSRFVDAHLPRHRWIWTYWWSRLTGRNPLLQQCIPIHVHLLHWTP